MASEVESASDFIDRWCNDHNGELDALPKMLRARDAAVRAAALEEAARKLESEAGKALTNAELDYASALTFAAETIRSLAATAGGSDGE